MVKKGSKKRSKKKKEVGSAGPLVEWFKQNQKILYVSLGVLLVLVYALFLQFEPTEEIIVDSCESVSEGSRDECCVNKGEGDRFNSVKQDCVYFEDELDLVVSNFCASRQQTQRVYRCWDFAALFDASDFSTTYYRFDGTSFNCPPDNYEDLSEECKLLSSGSNCRKMCY